MCKQSSHNIFSQTVHNDDKLCTILMTALIELHSCVYCSECLMNIEQVNVFRCRIKTML
jgi:hypothetical protein